jgi:hypothetical protein
MEATEATTITEDLNIPSENLITNDFYVVGYFKLALQNLRLRKTKQTRIFNAELSGSF